MVMTLAPLSLAHPVHAKYQVERSVGSKARVKQTDGRTDTTDCRILPALAGKIICDHPDL